jgi:V8-like Glu-specific endopeptidase
MGILDYRQEKMLNEALREAFPSPELFQNMLQYELGLNVWDYVGPSDSALTRVRQIINYFEARDTTVDLINGARASNPTNAKLVRISQLVAATFVAPSKDELEAMIGDELETSAVTSWRERLGAIEGQVCRIANPDLTVTEGGGFGSGFLVAPNVVLTNWHVVNSKHFVEDKIRFQFDYKKKPDGSMNFFTDYGLAADWLLAEKPPTAHERDPKNVAYTKPKEDELDFALIRLDGSPGSKPIGENVVDGLVRGYVQLPGKKIAGDNRVLFIIQHPHGKPMELAVNIMKPQVSLDDLRIFYETDTLAGSSGSPCFNWNLDLVGLHHGFNGILNRGIPIRKIARYLHDNGLLDDKGNIVSVEEESEDESIWN